jgi:lipopolysaccharide biosynthesis glycosyltransferase
MTEASTMTRAVCYTATAGYLFQTVVSAVQARQHTSSEVDVTVVAVGDATSVEHQVFERICADHGISVLAAPPSSLQGLHPMYARLFLDLLLPPEVDEVLYLDGDTQVVGDITPLVEASPPPGGALASLDPMVFIRRADARARARIDGWWDSSGIPAAVRGRYVNSGVLRLARRDIGRLRDDALRQTAEERSALRFPDQDSINTTLGDLIVPVSMSWNFPGFLLDTQLVELAPPRIIHFMSDPRPWNAALTPWGRTYHQPYADFVSRHPEAAPYWSRLSGAPLLRYRAQQRFKWATERRVWQSPEAARAVTDLERGTLALAAR